MSRLSEKDGFSENHCGAANPCVCPYDFVKFCSEKSYADVFYRQKPTYEAGFLLYGTFADVL
jgi:hypothetical protein